MISKRFLGIDIGTSFIKIVEISGRGERRKLENYGQISATTLYEKPFRTFEKSTLLLSSQDISRAILAVIEEAKIKTRQAIFSLPDFSTFFTNFELPPMTKEELPQAVRYAARQHVPLPLGEVTLDWQVTEGEVGSQKKKKTKLKILLVAVPKEVINQYKKIAQISRLRLFALEAEVFSLVRSSIKNHNLPALKKEKKAVMIVDIGAQSTTCNIIEKRILTLSHSFDMSGNEFTQQIARGLNVDYKTAKDLKKKYGILVSPDSGSESEKNIRTILLPLIDVILREIEKISRDFYQREGKEVQKFIIAGGTALLPGLKEYFQDYFKKEVEITNPFTDIFYPPILEKKLKEMGPAYAIAVGTALRGFE